MHLFNILQPALLVSSFFGGAEALRSGSKVKLSKIQSLTLRKGLETSHRRVSAIPQLKCIGGSGRGLYEVDVMRCKNSGSDYDDENIQWTCTASLPEEFKLGSTDVICEGYDYPDDPYILKGSCGVEYRLVLTEKGEKKYGKGRKPWPDDDDEFRSHLPKTTGEKVASALFFVVFIAVALWMLYSACIGWAQRNVGAVRGGFRPGWGGGGGWGGNDDPPPPYDYQPPSNPSNPKSRPNYGTNEGWRPGFWSGALGGAAAGWAAGRYGNNNNNRSNNTGTGWGSGNGSRWNNGEGSSRRSSGSSSSPSHSTTRYESTGFGSTSRR